MDGNEKEDVCVKIDGLSEPMFQKITKLDLSGQSLSCVPEDVGKLMSLQSLVLSNNKLKTIPSFIQNLLQLKELIADHNLLSNVYQPLNLHFKSDPESKPSEDSIYTDEELNSTTASGAVQNEQELNLCLLPKLYKIDLSDNSYFEFPQSLCKARSIVKLNMSGNPIRCLPSWFKSYKVIRHLILERIEFSHMFELPYWLFNVKRCTVISFAYTCVGCLMENIPTDIGYVCRLITKLDLRGVGLRDFPECVLSMLDLEYLWLSNTRTAPKLNPRSDVDLSMNMVWQIPTHLASLTALTHFEVSNVRLSIIPSSFCCLTNLKHFNASSNAIESLPNHLFDLVNLIHLNLSDNELVFLPGGLGKLHKLTVLNLAYNKIYDVRELEKLDTLLEFDVYSNRLTEIDLPVSIQKLDLAKNRISQQYLIEKYGPEFLDKYDRWQAALRDNLDGLDEERGNVEEMLEEISESIKYGMSDVSSDECSFEQEEVVNIATTQQEDKQNEETDDEEDWDQFIPVRKTSNKVKTSSNNLSQQQKYKSYPDTETKDAVFCPAESHPLSLVKTSSTARASSLNQKPAEIVDSEGKFEDADE